MTQSTLYCHQCRNIVHSTITLTDSNVYEVTCSKCHQFETGTLPYIDEFELLDVPTDHIIVNVNIHELIKYCFDNSIEDVTFEAENTVAPRGVNSVRISGSGNVKVSGYIDNNAEFHIKVPNNHIFKRQASNIMLSYYDANRLIQTRVFKGFSMDCILNDPCNRAFIRTVRSIHVQVDDDFIETWNSQELLTNAGKLI